MELITETNYQYYQASQLFLGTGATGQKLQCTFDIILNDEGESIRNYVLEYKVSNGVDYIIYPSAYSLTGNNEITLVGAVDTTTSLRVRAIQKAKWNNYGGYEYINLNEIIANFMMAYVGSDKLISSARRTDVIFHAKRGLQEFSYDTLKSVKSKELTIPHSLSLPIPQDYVNYVQLSWVDQAGVKHIIYPANDLTSNPTPLIQDEEGLPTQDYYGDNIESAQSFTTERWSAEDIRNLNGELDFDNVEANVYGFDWWRLWYGQRYGLEPQVSQKNGWFTINERTGIFNFSSNLRNSLIIIDYVSDGLGYDEDTKVPKMAEDAMYSHIMYSILSTRPNIPEYIVQRYKRERSAKLRNAKIRLSNIKLEAFTQVMRGKSKWIKH
jgi:hypothetical protein